MAEDFEPIEPLEPVKSFVPPIEGKEPIPYTDDKVLDIVNQILNPKGIQRLQFTEIEVSWIRDLIKTDLTNYALEIVKHASDPNFNWAELNETLGYREINEILTPAEVAQYSLARWQRGKGRKLIKDAHELSVSAGSETEEAKLMRTGFRG